MASDLENSITSLTMTPDEFMSRRRENPPNTSALISLIRGPKPTTITQEKEDELRGITGWPNQGFLDSLR